VHDGVVAMDIQCGTFALSWAGSALSVSTGVTFPRAFAAAPIVATSVVNQVGTPQPRLVGSVGSLSAAGFSFQGVETRETAVTAGMFCHWIAIGPRA